MPFDGTWNEGPAPTPRKEIEPIQLYLFRFENAIINLAQQEKIPQTQSKTKIRWPQLLGLLAGAATFIYLSVS
jgi:hypothetical protein